MTVAAAAWLARTRASVASLPAIAALAFCWTALAGATGLATRWPLGADGRDVALSGWIDAMPTRDTGRTVFSLRVTAAASGRGPRRVRLSWYDPAPELAAGQALELVARLRAPRGLVNPGGFDYERWLLLEGYDATGYVRTGRAVEPAAVSLARGWLRLRARLAERIDAQIADDEAAALVTALVLGDRSRFSDRHWEVLQRTGTSHLVAVSGLHIGLVAALAYVVVLRIGLMLPYWLARHAQRCAAASCIVPAAIYAALAGFALPTRRALVMVLVAQVLVIAGARWPRTAGLSLALIVVLLLEPLASLTASLWLSFGAVVLLLATLRPLPPVAGGLVARLGAGVRSLWQVQWVLSLGLAPVVVWSFGLIVPASLPVNLLAIPVFSLFLVPFALVAAALALLSSDAAAGLTLAGAVAGRVWQALEWAAANPLAAYRVPWPGTMAIALAGLAIAGVVVRHNLPGRWLALVALLPLVAGGRGGPAPGEARVTVFDVGHGLAVAVETANHRLLYDAGPLYRSGFDAGAEVVGPALDAISRRPVELMLLSHGDSDHAGGAAALRSRYPELSVLAGPDVGIRGARVCRSGQQWIWDGVRFAVLHPPGDYPLRGNESSCVLRVDTAGGAVLLTGDIESKAEARLASEPRIAADVVVVPHHGSLTSSSPAFVRQVSADIAIVSAGFNNRWNFPRAEVTERWQSGGASVLVTGDHGAIDLHLTPQGITVDRMRDAERHYWQAKPRTVSGAAGASAL